MGKNKVVKATVGTKSIRVRKESGKIKNTYIKRNKYEDVMSVLIEMVIDYHGGAAAIAKVGLNPIKRTNYKLQDWVNWRNRGYVPIMHVDNLSRCLHITPYALNNTTYPLSKGERPRTMRAIIKELGFISEKDQEKLLTMAEKFKGKREETDDASTDS